MAKKLSVDDRQWLKVWEETKLGIINSAVVDTTESESDKLKRIKRLEANDEEWFAYYFPSYYLSKPAKFHTTATKRVMANARWYEVRAWSRELAKSTRTMMEVIKLALTGKIRNVLLVSNSKDNADRLLTPYKITLEVNQRIANDYGDQPRLGAWEDGEFTTNGGVSFRAIGAGQSPRGTRNEAARPDCILIDDIDTDEECRNPERIKTKWKWIEEALIPTISISGNYRIIFCGNIIAKDCCITRAIKMADHVDIVNIRDANGKSSWPEKNSEEDIDRILSLLSTASIQKEYYNNPISEGEVFKEITWGKCPPMHTLPFVVIFGDPGTSNKSGSKAKGASYKSVIAVGYHGGKYYVYDARLEQTKNSDFIQWYYDMRSKYGNKTIVYYVIENNSLQDPFWEQVLQPLAVKLGEGRGGMIPITTDGARKGDKYARIEATLEPLNRQSRLVFNIDEAGNPNMLRLEEQMLAVSPGLPAPADGPDCLEGAILQTNIKLASVSADAIVVGGARRNSKRY
ncbi:MAG: hypothetical protein PUK66_07140 [Bacteroidales bacterium]|uniref:hypothetical protein n=1 Tax=Porphyromonas sp. TaxID=1924944 RepID=UPI002977A8C2|nr:hypothetical protein [Porphyromonas sp.]MDD7438586.1 hypothetical protein [Bacteroidales bacterium]MDY3067842.1 hypothetical protein [Porphyromonas sp.]